jgi:hypothetical protein
MQRDAGGAVISQTQYLRDESGRVRESLKRSGAGIEHKLYDAQGNVVQASDAQGTRTYSHYEKDKQGRTLGYQEVDQTTGKSTRVITNPARSCRKWTTRECGRAWNQ